MLTLQLRAENMAIQFFGRKLTKEELEACEYASKEAVAYDPFIVHNDDTEQLKIGFMPRAKSCSLPR